MLFAPVAQRPEQRPSKPMVAGSNPAGGASLKPGCMPGFSFDPKSIFRAGGGQCAKQARKSLGIESNSPVLYEAVLCRYDECREANQGFESN